MTDTSQREAAERLRAAPAPRVPAPRLQRLADIFAIGDVDRDIIGALWMSCYDRALYTDLLAQEPWNACITPRGVTQLFGHPVRARLASTSPLRLWCMVHEQALMDGTASLSLDPHILAWLDGQPEPDRHLIGLSAALVPGIESASWPLDAWADTLADGLRRGVLWRVHVVASPAAAGDGAGDRGAELACVAALGERLGLPVLALQLRAPAALADAGTVPAAEMLKRLHRQAFLDSCAPCLIVDEGTLPELGHECAPFPLEFVLGPGARTAPAPAHTQTVQRYLRLQLPPLQAADRDAIWRAALPEASAWPAGQFTRLAEDSDASASEIMRAAAGHPESPAHAARLLTGAYRDQLQGLAQRIDARFRWDDLVLPAGALARLHEIAFEAGERQALWSDPELARMYPQGRGLIALLSGPPGTGKTMAAQVIAAELGLDLLRVDLSAVVSKWVGETAQHLQKILSARISRHAVLFFDEADALYGKRVEDTRDAQDRYVNMDISHLMVALENFDGVVLLATNLKGNIDGAFLRRIRHCVEFARPDAAARLVIWQRVLAAVFPQAREIRVDQLASLDATGAQIKQAALSAAFAVRRLACAPHTLLLAQMLAREIGKDGSGLSARELSAALEIDDQGVRG